MTHQEWKISMWKMVLNKFNKLGSRQFQTRRTKTASRRVPPRFNLFHPVVSVSLCIREHQKLLLQERRKLPPWFFAQTYTVIWNVFKIVKRKFTVTILMPVRTLKTRLEKPGKPGFWTDLINWKRNVVNLYIIYHF